MRNGSLINSLSGHNYDWPVRIDGTRRAASVELKTDESGQGYFIDVGTEEIPAEALPQPVAASDAGEASTETNTAGAGDGAGAGDDGGGTGEGGGDGGGGAGDSA